MEMATVILTVNIRLRNAPVGLGVAVREGLAGRKKVPRPLPLALPLLHRGAHCNRHRERHLEPVLLQHLPHHLPLQLRHRHHQRL